MLSQPGDFSEETEDSQCCSLKLLDEEEGYEADSESNPEDSDTQDDGEMSLMFVIILPVKLSIKKRFILSLHCSLMVSKRHCVIILFCHHNKSVN